MKNSKIIKKIILKTLLYTLLGILSFLAVVTILLQSHRVQTYLSSRTADFLSKELHTEISVTGVQISLPMSIVLKGVDINDLHHKKILSARRIVANIGGISFNKHLLMVDKVVLNNADIRIVKYKDNNELNLQFLIDYFSSPSAPEEKPKQPSRPWIVKCKALDINNSRFEYFDQRWVPATKGMDYNHIVVSNLNLIANRLKVQHDTISASILDLTCKEKSGFELKHFSTKARVSSRGINCENLIIRTPNSDLLLDLAFNYKNYNAFNYFVDSVKINSRIYPSELNLKDIIYYAPEMEGMNDRISLDGWVKGPVSNLKTRDFNFSFGDATHFSGNINLTGLPDIYTTFIHLDIKGFSTNLADLQKFYLPGNNNAIPIPQQVMAFGDVNINGLFTGFYNDFVAYGTFHTDLGGFSTDLSVQNNHKEKSINYQGNLLANRFDLGTLISSEDYIGKLNANLQLKGSGLTLDKMRMTLDGKIDSLDFRGLNYSNILIKGNVLNKQFNGLLNVNDKNIQFDFAGLVDFGQELPVFNFTSHVEHAKLTMLRLTDRDSLSELNTVLNFNFQGNTIDNLQGYVKCENTTYTEHNELYRMNHFELNTAIDNAGNKEFNFTSDFIDANLIGKFSFLDFYHSFNKLLNYYLPSFMFRSDTIKESNNEQNFTYYILLKNTESLSKLFLPTLQVAPGTFFNGNYNSTHEVANITGKSNQITFNGMRFKNWLLEGKSEDRHFVLNTGCNRLALREPKPGDSLSLGLDSLYLQAKVFGDSINYNLAWDDIGKVNHNKANISGYLNFAHSPSVLMRITNGEILINDSLWKVSYDNIVVLDTNAINFYNLAFRCKTQSIALNGVISHDPLDKLNIDIRDFNFDYVDFLLQNSGLDFDGVLDGKISMINLYDAPNFLCNLKARNFCFNKEKLGDLLINTSWDKERNALQLNAKVEYTGNVGISYPLSCNGWYAPGKKKENFDFDINLQNLKIKTLSPFVKGIFSGLKGYASGDFKMNGTIEQPVLTGKLKLMRSEFKVDYLNVSYSLAHEVNFDKNRIWFKGLIVNDTLGNTGICNGTITHDYFKDFRLDLSVKTKKLAGLHTDLAQNSTFYGNALVSGEVKISGPINNIDIDVQVASEKGTELFIPVNLTADVSENDFIRFTNVNDAIKAHEDKVDMSGLSVNLDLNVTPDAEIEIFLPLQMGNIRVNGTGLLKMGVNTSGDFQMYGDYTMNEGTFFFSLQNMINRHFVITKGGTIRWNGDPADANIDLSATYKLKASLSGLPIDSSLVSQRLPVDCIVTMKNKLTNPDISFKIRLPDADEKIAQQVFSIVDTTDQVEMNKQMISLLVMNNFSFSSRNSSVASSVSSSSFQLLSNQLSNWLSQISKDFDIGVNYRPGDKISSEQLELALSTQLFNNRLQIDGNFGVNGNQNVSGNQQNNNIIGDVNIEYKITKDGRYRAKAYNKSNAYDLYNDNALYTQGVGVFYRKEFDKFGDLFKRKKKKEK